MGGEALNETERCLRDFNALGILANFSELRLIEKDYDRINVNSFCVAIGNSLGCTGTRILTTLLYEMKRRNTRHGLLTICGGKGMGVFGIGERKQIIFVI